MTRVAACLLLLSALTGQAEELDFNRDVRPILSDRCFKCHGPDVENRKGGLGLNAPEDATKKLKSGARAVIPGDAAGSAAVVRMLSTDPDEQMPPPDSGLKVTAAEIEILRRWIAQGAQFEPHWALRPARRLEPPAAAFAGVPVHNAIDRFVQAGLRDSGLSPSPEADRHALVRRLYLDLIGLPPTIEETAAFVNDRRPDAYEQLVDGLLQNPHFGERWARWWLDQARYADTNGYESDEDRSMWPWRDWVIQAFNSNMPFDQFTVEQLAGDLLPNATADQRIATGFSRNSLINTEGGAKNDEFKDAAIKDRVETMGAVWLGATLLCAQCHTHKYDPITNVDYYSLYAIFASTTDKAGGFNGKGDNDFLKVAAGNPTERARLTEAVRAAHDKVTNAAAVGLSEAAVKALATLAARGRWPLWRALGNEVVTSEGGATATRQNDGSWLFSGVNPTVDTCEFTGTYSGESLAAIRVEALPDPSMTDGSLARSVNGNFVMTGVEVAILEPGQKAYKSVPLLNARAEYEQKSYPVSAALAFDNASGWAVDGNLRAQRNVAVFAPAAPVKIAAGTTVRVRIISKSQFQNHVPGRLRIGLAEAGKEDLYAFAAAPGPALRAARAWPAAAGPDRQVLAAWLGDGGAKDPVAEKALKAAEDALAAFDQTGSATTMVMIEGKPVPTFVQNRGNFLELKEQVEPGVPASFGLPAVPIDGRINRLSLARWLVNPDHPRTARVTANRIWDLLFGRAIVTTSEDFGYQSDWPSNPQLLDWLGTELVRDDWNIKAFIRTIVMSHTYRQSSVATPATLEKDFYNARLARGARYRVEAEMIRDIALRASGLLSPKIGGPSVFPPQPAVIFENLFIEGGIQKWGDSTGEDRYRRGVYTFVKRTALYPLMATFDAPSRTVCVVARKRSNTPLQALNLMNDPAFFEAAGALGAWMGTQPGDVKGQIDLGFRRCATRPPRADEMRALSELYQHCLSQYRNDAASANKLLTSAGLKAAADPAAQAAWVVVANTLLNMDATLNRL